MQDEKTSPNCPSSAPPRNGIVYLVLEGRRNVADLPLCPIAPLECQPPVEAASPGDGVAALIAFLLPEIALLPKETELCLPENASPPTNRICALYLPPYLELQLHRKPRRLLRRNHRRSSDHARAIGPTFAAQAQREATTRISPAPRARRPMLVGVLLLFGEWRIRKK